MAKIPQYEVCPREGVKRQTYKYYYLIRKKAKKPTKARPGTLAKIKVLAYRWRTGKILWHEDDAQ